MSLIYWLIKEFCIFYYLRSGKTGECKVCFNSVIVADICRCYTRCFVNVDLCECVCVFTELPIRTSKCEVYLFGLSLFFVPERKCDAVLRSYAFIWKIGQFPRESLSRCFRLSLFHVLPPDICLSFSLPISFLICPIVHVFTPTSLVFYFLHPFSLLLTFQSFSHLLPAFALSPFIHASCCFSALTPCLLLSYSVNRSLSHVQTLARTCAPTHSLHSHSHTHTLNTCLLASSPHFTAAL